MMKTRGVMSALVINDLDAGVGRLVNTQCTVNNQIVVATLMNLCDNPTNVSVGEQWIQGEKLSRVPIIVTGNDFTKLYAPLIRDGRMEKYYWQPSMKDRVQILTRMFRSEGLDDAQVTVFRIF